MPWRSWLYVRLLQEAFPGAWAACWILSTIATILCGLYVLFLPIESKTVALLVAVLPLGIFAAIMIGGPLRAACRIIREQERELASLKADRIARTEATALIQLTITEIMVHRDTPATGNVPQWLERWRAIKQGGRDRIAAVWGEGITAIIFGMRRPIDMNRSNYGPEHREAISEIEGIIDGLVPLEARAATCVAANVSASAPS